MNRIILITTLVLLFSSFVSCECNDCDGHLYPVKATFHFINETSLTITNDFADEFDEILPNSTVIMKEERVLEQNGRPTIDNYSPIINTRTFFYKDGNTLKCEYNARDITNYENRKEVEDLVFEFTFRFTEERFQNAQECQ